MHTHKNTKLVDRVHHNQTSEVNTKLCKQQLL